MDPRECRNQTVRLHFQVALSISYISSCQYFAPHHFSGRHMFLYSPDWGRQISHCVLYGIVVQPLTRHSIRCMHKDPCSHRRCKSMAVAVESIVSNNRTRGVSVKGNRLAFDFDIDQVKDQEICNQASRLLLFFPSFRRLIFFFSFLMFSKTKGASRMPKTINLFFLYGPFYYFLAAGVPLPVILLGPPFFYYLPELWLAFSSRFSLLQWNGLMSSFSFL